MRKIPITLSDEELELGAFVGMMRRAWSVKNKKMHNWVIPDTWGGDIEAALGELAVSKMLNMHWNALLNRKEDREKYPDIGTENYGCEVKTTKYKNGCLVIQKRNAPDRFYWLVTGQLGDYTVHGGIFAKDGQQEKYWTDKNGDGAAAFYVPQSDLYWPEIVHGSPVLHPR